jgi:type II secretion system protein G
MKNKKWIAFKNKKWFTLIEMLIVIVIIGILAAAIIPRLNSARGRANDVARKADLNQVATALITYQLDTGGFPATWTTIDNISDKLIKGWMTSIPKDPANNETFSWIQNIPAWDSSPYYLYQSIDKSGIPDGGFVLMAKMESHGQSNYVFCDNGSIDEIMDLDDYNDIYLCSTLTQADDWCNNDWEWGCKYDNLGELRYIYKY